MPSSYTPSLRLTLPVTGELAGTWGSTVNTGVTTLAEAAIAGTAAVAMTDADYTLTTVNGATDQARNMFITLTGTLTVSRNVICPAVSKLYVVTNSTTGSQNIVFKTSAGAGITIANGQRKMVYCNGTDVVDATTSFTSIIFDAGTVSAPSITFAGSTNTGFWRPAVSTVALSTAGVERLRVDSSGNLGIGTSSPTAFGAGYTTLSNSGCLVTVLKIGCRALRAPPLRSSPTALSGCAWTPPVTSGLVQLRLHASWMSTGQSGLLTPPYWNGVERRFQSTAQAQRTP